MQLDGFQVLLGQLFLALPHAVTSIKGSAFFASGYQPGLQMGAQVITIPHPGGLLPWAQLGHLCPGALPWDVESLGVDRCSALGPGEQGRGGCKVGRREG